MRLQYYLLKGQTNKHQNTHDCKSSFNSCKSRMTLQCLVPKLEQQFLPTKYNQIRTKIVDNRLKRIIKRNMLINMVQKSLPNFVQLREKNRQYCDLHQFKEETFLHNWVNKSLKYE